MTQVSNSALRAGQLIVVGGPTASGKTKTAVALAMHLGTEVISADSRQFYREMSIGTARPTEAEMQGVKHHFVGHLSIHGPLSAGRYEEQAIALLDGLFASYGAAVLTGGSGLYVDAVCHGFDHLPPADPQLRSELQQRFEKEGLAKLIEELTVLDPELMKNIDQQNPHRVIRALEICRITGKPASEQRTGKRTRPGIDILKFALDVPRKELYARINARVDCMMQAGLLEEVKELLPHRDLPPLRTVGYQEIFEYLDGKCDLPTAVEKIKQHTKNYAKRQLTWMRKDEDQIWGDMNLFLSYLK